MKLSLEMWTLEFHRYALEDYSIDMYSLIEGKTPSNQNLREKIYKNEHIRESSYFIYSRQRMEGMIQCEYAKG